MKKKLLSSTLLTAMVLSLVTCGAASVSAAETPEAAESSPASATDSSSEDTGEAPDYSQEDCWLQIPEITKDIDTFYGEFQAGKDPEAQSPLTDFTFEDLEPKDAVGRGDK